MDDFKEGGVGIGVWFRRKGEKEADREVAEGLVGIQWEEDVHYSLEGRKVDFARLALAMYMGAYGMVVFSEWDEGGLPS